jgi:hypothetical protein
VGERAGVKLVGGYAKLEGTLRILVPDPVCLSHHAAGDGDVLRCNGPVSLVHGDHRGHERRDQQAHQSSNATTSQAHSAAVLANVLTHQHVFGNLTYGCGHVGHALPQPWVGLVHLVCLVQPTQVHPTRLLDKGAV